MLGKLIKYDFRSLGRKFAPLWAALAALAALNGFTIRHVLGSGNFTGFLNFLLGVLPIILLIVLWAALAIMALVFIVQRFYKGLLGDEGYLMFTLPVTNAQHIAAKTVTALILLVITAVVAALSGLLLLTVYNPQGVGDVFSAAFRVLREEPIPGQFWWILAEAAVLCLAAVVADVLQIYAAISLGHLSKKHRGGTALLAYVGINVALSVLLSALVPALERLPLEEMSFYVDGYGVHVGKMFGAAAAVIGVGILWEVIKGAAFFLGSNAILNRKLNLE